VALSKPQGEDLIIPEWLSRCAAEQRKANEQEQKPKGRCFEVPTHTPPEEAGALFLTLPRTT
jgi:hypothetical protein